MDKKLEAKLVNRFHYFHAEEYKNPVKRWILRTFNRVKSGLLLAWMTKTPAYPFEYFGFECEDGWFQLLWDLCIEIEPYCGKHFHVTQVKEKFGGLCFYTSGWDDDKVHDIISKYESLSYETCETCGKKGKEQTVFGWTKTLCTKCLRVWKEEQERRFNPDPEDDGV